MFGGNCDNCLWCRGHHTYYNQHKQQPQIHDDDHDIDIDIEIRADDQYDRISETLSQTGTLTHYLSPTRDTSVA